MTDRNTWSPRAGDVLSALGLLTRLPLPRGGSHRGAEAAWAWPLAGLIVGALGGAAGMALLWAGMPSGIAAAAVLGVQMLATGALHEDGLADSADGLWGGHDPARRLEIMKDSRIGTFGMLALSVTILARWSAVAALLTAGAWPAILAAAALSRAPMAVVMAALPNARSGGVSRAIGRPGARPAILAAILAAALALFLTEGALAMALAAGLAAAIPAGLAVRRIGGQTGDILGAVQQVAETAALATAAAILAPIHTFPAP